MRRRWFDPWVGDALEKVMATHSRILVWEMPWTEPVHSVAVHSVQSIELQSPQDL